jgi:hypothetical protein
MFLSTNCCTLQPAMPSLVTVVLGNDLDTGHE